MDKPLYQNKLEQIPSDLITVADYEQRAKEFIPHAVYEYIAGGSGSEQTLRENVNAFERIKISNRLLNDCSE